MIRIWAKVIREEKILKDMIFEQEGFFNPDFFHSYLEEMCHKLEIATPIVLSKHIKHYLYFNNTSFSPDDFAEVIDFDKFVVEEASL